MFSMDRTGPGLITQRDNAPLEEKEGRGPYQPREAGGQPQLAYCYVISNVSGVL